MSKAIVRISLLMVMLSITVLFGAMGLAFLAMPNRTDVVYRVPSLFFFGTVLLLASSVLMHRAWLRRNTRPQPALLVAIGLGGGFMLLQGVGWAQLYLSGLFPADSGPKVSFLYLLSLLHGLHLVAALVLVGVVFRSPEPGKHRLFEASVYFWHFLGILWAYLLLVLNLG